MDYGINKPEVDTSSYEIQIREAGKAVADVYVLSATEHQAFKVAYAEQDWFLFEHEDTGYTCFYNIPALSSIKIKKIDGDVEK
jgi:hypothetical protein